MEGTRVTNLTQRKKTNGLIENESKVRRCILKSIKSGPSKGPEEIWDQI